MSYARRDERRILPIAAILRGAGVSVFRDVDNIPPGAKWMLALADELDNATAVYVFWSRHARASTWVKKEYGSAVENGKRVVPVLLDRTPLPEDLGQYQAIDLRHLTFGDSFSISNVSAWFRNVITRRNLAIMGGIGVTMIVAVVASLLLAAPLPAEGGLPFVYPNLFMVVALLVMLFLASRWQTPRVVAAKKAAWLLAQHLNVPPSETERQPGTPQAEQ
jgi:hypothetical protein